MRHDQHRSAPRRIDAMVRLSSASIHRVMVDATHNGFAVSVALQQLGELGEER